MAWIKRNLIFVISAAVGLILTGYCGYLLYTAVSDNAAVSDDYQQTQSNLQAIEQKVPYPSQENIKNAQEDEKAEKKFLDDFRKNFALFPAPPVVDVRGFKTYLDDTLVKYRAGADAAGVQLPANFSFGFADLNGKLTYPLGNIEPWMEQMEEIQSILDILYAAKVNSIDALFRVPVSADDSGAGLSATPVTNQWGIETPYKITFHGFSAEIGSVLEGFARSSHCFIVKSLFVVPDTAAQSYSAPAPMRSEMPIQQYQPQPQYPMPGRPYGEGRARGEPGGGMPYYRPAPAPGGMTPAAAAFAGPTTILSELPLVVTISVDVVKLKAEK